MFSAIELFWPSPGMTHPTRQASTPVGAGPAARPKDGTAPPGAIRALMVATPGATGERTQPAAYPHGRDLTIDVFSARIAFLASGKAGSGGLRPHHDLLAQFPFPGPPNP
jgi:hypothetical protein